MKCSIHTPPWLIVARAHIGQRETLGPNDSHWLQRMWANLGASWLNGQPWCGGAMANWMSGCQISYPKTYYRARDWLDWGIELADPCIGAVLVFDRPGGAHVALCEGVNLAGDLMCLGGNQGDAVSVVPIRRNRLLGSRWPAEWADMHRITDLPLIDTTAPRSTNEA